MLSHYKKICMAIFQYHFKTPSIKVHKRPSATPHVGGGAEAMDSVGADAVAVVVAVAVAVVIDVDVDSMMSDSNFNFYILQKCLFFKINKNGLDCWVFFTSANINVSICFCIMLRRPASYH